MTVHKPNSLWLCLAGVLMLQTACFKATFNPTPKAASGGTLQEEWTDFFIFGLVGEQNFDAAGMCPSGVAQVRTGGNFGTGLVSALTIGIYTPRKVYVRCNAAAADAVATLYTIDADRNGRPVRLTQEVGAATQSAEVVQVGAQRWKATLAKAEVQP
jgi:hypothetical protein